jgi:hypothetical protein
MSSPGPAKAPVGPAQYLIVSVVGLGLIIGGIAVLLLTPVTFLGLAMVAAGFVLRTVTVILNGVSRWQALLASPPVWWFNPRTQQLAEGRFAPGLGWDGPYTSREDAARAPEIARSRAAEWNAED